MPLYEYYCTDGRHTFERLRPMVDATAESACPDHGSAARRTISVFATIGKEGEATWLTPESAAGSNAGGCCGGGCGCG